MLHSGFVYPMDIVVFGEIPDVGGTVHHDVEKVVCQHPDTGRVGEVAIYDVYLVGLKGGVAEIIFPSVLKILVFVSKIPQFCFNALSETFLQDVATFLLAQKISRLYLCRRKYLILIFISI